MIFELCPTLSRDLIKREFLNTAAAFGVLVLLGFAAGMLFPDMAQQTLQNFAAQVEQLGLTDDVPQSQMMATLFFNNITASLLSMLYGLIPFLPLSALALGTNALMLGAFAAIYQQQGIGLGVYVLGVLPHGIFELSALILSCALGLLICRTGTERILKKSDTPFFRRVLDCIRVFLTFSVPLLLVAALAAAPFLIRGLIDRSDTGKEPTAAVTPTPETTAEPTPTPEPTPLQFTTVDASYFDDALFIGDSRTVGIAEYGNLKNATYFADVGLNVYVAQTKAVAVKNVGTVTLPQLLSQKTFGKVYIMLGINELGTGTAESWAAQYKVLLDEVRELQPDAIIFLQAIFHTTQEKSDATFFKNSTIDARNAELQKLADNETVFYIDCNPVFDDSTGALTPEYSGDGVHVKAAYYPMWRDYLFQFGVVR